MKKIYVKVSRKVFKNLLKSFSTKKREQFLYEALHASVNMEICHETLNSACNKLKNAELSEKIISLLSCEEASRKDMEKGIIKILLE